MKEGWIERFSSLSPKFLQGTSMESLPFQSHDLILQLDKAFPERCPNPSTPDREIWMYAGKRELVRGLVAQLKAQEEDQFNV